jgi:hypothetical protein
MAELPPLTLLGLTLNEVSSGGAAGVPTGFTVRGAECVTPAAETDSVTMVGTVTARCRMLKLPRVEFAGTTAIVDRNGNTVGLSLFKLT